MLGIKDVNRHPIVHTWSYKLAEAAQYDSNQGNADLVRKIGFQRFKLHWFGAGRKWPRFG